MLLEAKVEPCDFIAKRAVSAQVSCPDLKGSHRNCSAPGTTEKRASVFHENRGTHLWTSKMSEVVEPVHVGPTVVKGVNELMRDHSVHVGLLVDVVLTQDDLQARGKVKHPGYCKAFKATRLGSYLRGSSIKAAAHRPVAVFTGEMSVI